MRLLSRALCASFFLAENSHALFRNRPHHLYCGWVSRRPRAYTTNTHALIIPPGGSKSIKDDDEEKYEKSENKSDNGELSDGNGEKEKLPANHSDRGDDCNSNLEDNQRIDGSKDGSESIAFEKDYDENSNIEVIPFDDEYDDSPKDIPPISEGDVDHPSSSGHDENSNIIEVIPFDDEYGDSPKDNVTVSEGDVDHPSSSGHDENSSIEVKPFDDDSQKDHLSDDAGDDLLKNQVIDKHPQNNQEGNQTAINDMVDLDTHANVTSAHVYAAESLAADFTSCTASMDEREEKTNKIPSLRLRILERLRRWKECDDTNSHELNTASIRNLMYERSEEYIKELLEFEIECEDLLSSGISLPNLSKMPNPKKFLHFIAPKIKTIKTTPEIMMQIRSTKPGDISVSISVIGILSCLVDLYSIVLKKLNSLGTDFDSEQNFDELAIKNEIIRDRRFGQLLECASCGLDVDQRLEHYCAQKRKVAEADIKRGDDQYLSYCNFHESPQLERIPASDIVILMQGLLALGVGKDIVIGHSDATSCMIALCMHLHEELFVNHRRRTLDDAERMLLLHDVVDSIRILTCAKDAFDIDISLTIQLCLHILGESVCISNADEDIKVDTIVDRLALSEVNVPEDDSKNITLAVVNNTKVSKLTEVIPYNETSDKLLLVDHLSQTQQVLILKCLANVEIFQGQPGEVLKYILQKIIDEMQKTIRICEKVEIRDDADIKEFECVDAAVLLSSRIVSEPECHVGVDLNDAVTITEEQTKGETGTAILASSNAFREIETRIIRGDFDKIEPNDSLGGNGDARGLARKKNSEVYADLWGYTIYDCSVIIKAASSIDHEFASTAVKCCLQVAENVGYEQLLLLDTEDSVNFVFGITKIISASETDDLSLKRIAFATEQMLKKHQDSFSMWEVSCLLNSLATLISTQTSPNINELANAECVHDFIECAITKMRISSNASAWDLANLSWSYAECNKEWNKASWGHFEVLGRSAAAATSVLTSETAFLSESEYNSVKEFGCGIFCNLLFALSLSSLNLNTDLLLNSILLHFQNCPEHYSECKTLDYIRLLHSIAKLKSSSEGAHRTHAESYAIKTCFNGIQKFEGRLSLRNLALVVWSYERLGERSDKLSTKIPLYTKRELEVVSFEQIIGLVSAL